MTTGTTVFLFVKEQTTFARTESVFYAGMLQLTFFSEQIDPCGYLWRVRCSD